LRMEVLARGVVDGVLAAINRQLVTGNRSCMFVTLFVAILDVTRGRLCYVNGGHPPPLLGGNARPAAPIPVPPGILLGVQEEAEFPVAELTLVPGDVLTLYTDGITEAENAHGEQFSDPRLRELLATSPREDASARVRQLRNAVHTFTAGAPQSDDITLLVLCYDPSATRGG